MRISEGRNEEKFTRMAKMTEREREREREREIIDEKVRGILIRFSTSREMVSRGATRANDVSLKGRNKLSCDFPNSLYC